MFKVKNLYKNIYCLGFLFLSVFLFASCCSSLKTTGSIPNNKTYEKIARENFKGDVVFLFNESQSHVVCINNIKTTQYSPHPAVNFFIFDIASDSIIFEDHSVPALLKWISDTTVEINITPEIINEDDRLDGKNYIFDIVQKKRIFKKDF